MSTTTSLFATLSSRWSGARVSGDRHRARCRHLATIAEIRPSVVILDLSLGRHDAVEVLHGLADASYPGRVLLVSGRSRDTLLSVNAIGCGVG